MFCFRSRLLAALTGLALTAFSACQESGNPDRDNGQPAEGTNATTTEMPEGDNTVTTQPDRDQATGDNAAGTLTDTMGGARTTNPSGGTGSGNAQPGSSGTGLNGTGNGGH